MKFNLTVFTLWYWKLDRFTPKLSLIKAKAHFQEVGGGGGVEFSFPFSAAPNVPKSK